MSARLLIVLTLIAMGTIGFVFGEFPPQVETAGQQHVRKLKDRLWKNEPVKVIAVTGKGGRSIAMGENHLAEDDWLRDLTISLKNTSNKDILFVELELHFLRPKESPDATITAFPIIFGTPPKLTKEQSPRLLPGESWSVSLSDEEYAGMEKMLTKSGNLSSIKEVEIITREVLFADKSKWSEGRVRDSTKLVEPEGTSNMPKKKIIVLSFSQ